jgi:hypothetical protein
MGWTTRPGAGGGGDRPARREWPRTGQAAGGHDHRVSPSHLKELRVGTVRVLFVFDPWRDCVLLVAGDKAKRWSVWYTEAIPAAEQRYEVYLKERSEERAAEERLQGRSEQEGRS